MPRIFTAIEIPAPLRLRLSMLRGSLRGARWLEPEHYHLTLRFFGDVEARVADEIVDLIDRIEGVPLEVRLAELASFGGDHPRAIIMLAAPSPELAALQLGHEAAARAAGLEPEPRKFAPHVTLARLKGTRSREVGDYLSQFAGFVSEAFPVTRTVLMSARPGTGGGPYVVEAEFPLGDAEAEDDEQEYEDEASWS